MMLLLEVSISFLVPLLKLTFYAGPLRDTTARLSLNCNLVSFLVLAT